MSGTFDGFDVEQVRALAKAVGKLDASATAISTSVGAVDSQAQEYLNLGYGIPPQVIRANLSPMSAADPSLAPLYTVSSAAPGVAKEITRRLAYLTACIKIELDGYPIDPDVVFEDGPPPSEQKIKAALSSLPGELDKFYSGDADDDLVNTLSGLDNAELDAVIGKLSDADLQKMGMAVSMKQVVSIDGNPYGMSNDQRVALSNTLLAKLGSAQLARVTSFVSLQPNIDIKGVDGTSWTPDLNPLYGPDGKASIEDINQGEAGDCWFLAAIGAELVKNPDFVNQHIHENANGTYTVTFYEDGKTVPITVDNTVLTQSGGTSPFVHPTGSWTTDGPAWIMIYEKAFAQLHGSYNAIQGGWGSEGMSELTGKSSDKSSPGSTDISQMQKDWDSGHPITVGTTSHTTGYLWWTTHHDSFDVDDQKLISSHEYTVVGFGTADDHPGEVKLRNPWGNTTNATEYVWVNQNELDANFGEVSIGND